jgi:AcrR family transcriptional regulator
VKIGDAVARSIEQPRNARSRRTNAALLAATRELIETSGFEALTMAAVAERAGVSRRAAYLHFSTRTELVTGLYRSLGQTEDLASSLQAVWDCPDAVSALREWAHHIARSHPRILSILRAVERSRHTDPDAAELWHTTLVNWHKGSRRLAQWLADDGSMAPAWTVDTAADMLWALMSLDLLDRLLTDRHWSRKRLGTVLATALHNTFVGPPTHRPLPGSMPSAKIPAERTVGLPRRARSR